MPTALRITPVLGVPASRIDVIPNGVDSESFRPAASRKRRAASIIGSVGSLTPVKNHALLIHACAALIAGGQEVELRLAGEGPERGALERLAAWGAVAVLGPICLNGQGGILNVNADHIAAAVAGALGAEKIVFLSDVKGVLRNESKEDSLAAGGFRLPAYPSTPSFRSTHMCGEFRRPEFNYRTVPNPCL